jgi:nitroreductase
MHVKEAIERRRSIRKFTNAVLQDSLILDLVEAARLAPSGSNAQPIRVFAVRSKETKELLKKAKVFEQGFVCKAPAILVICGNPAVYGEGETESLKGKNSERCLRDLSIASSFMVLRATELGLATCYVGLMDRHALKRALKIPDEYMMPFVLCVGYPDEAPGPLCRKKLEELILGGI